MIDNSGATICERAGTVESEESVTNNISESYALLQVAMYVQEHYAKGDRI